MAVEGLTTESIGAASTGMSKVNASIVQADADVLRIAGAAARDDRDVVERVRPLGPLGAADLDVAHVATAYRSAYRARVTRFSSQTGSSDS